MFADNLASDFGSRRPLTPLDTIVPEETWWQSLCSNCCMACDNVLGLWRGPWCGFFDGKFAAVFSCFSLPCRVLSRATGEHQNPMKNFRHSGIVYLYVLLCCTIVFNLVELKMFEEPGDNETSAQRVRQYFVIVCMTMAIAEMLYLYLFTYGNVQPSEHRDGPLRIYFQGGLYLFGFVSMGHAVCEAINNFTCKHMSIAATVQTMKAFYIVSQTLFLNCFYQARIPDGTLFVQVVLAHLLGTNISLWFWTLCSEIVTAETQNNSTSKFSCTDYPIELGSSSKYFYPLFVEYLILAASIMYEVWRNLLTAETPRLMRAAESNEQEMNNPRNLSRRQRYIPSCGCGLVFGACFAVIFVVLILASSDNGRGHHVYFKAYSGGTLALYLSQIIACYIVQLSLQSQRRKRENILPDHDDFLLYISLGGILLWEGFHMFSLLLKGNDNIAMMIVVDVVGCVQHLSQAVTLINMRRYRSTIDRNSAWIRECILFMLITNLGLWIENSFFLEAILDRPGESHKDLEENLVAFSYILRPLTIFFRFHSATCFYYAWTVFKART